MAAREDPPGFDPTPADLAGYFDPVLHELTALIDLSDPTPRGPFRSHRPRAGRYVSAAKGVASALGWPLNRFLFQRQAALNGRVLSALVGLVRRMGWLAERWTRQERELAELRAQLDDARKRLAEIEARTARP
jgi:hypothetical protein